MTQPDPLSTRSNRTRTAMIAAGFELLVERPIDAIPIDDVVAKAGVAKGSFFNHFTGKQDFAKAIATEVRKELEAMVGNANLGVSDPVERIAGGMRVVAQFAMSQPRRATVMLRSHASSTMRNHPLNRGLVEDFEAALAHGQLRPEAEECGVLFWMGLCQALMTNIVERAPTHHETASRLADMMVLGLVGIGVDPARARAIAGQPVTFL